MESWLVVAIPTYAVVPSAIVSLPRLVHDDPVDETYAVTCVPTRFRRTRSGACRLAPGVFVELPPVWRRRWNASPLPAETSANACAEFAASDARIMTPDLDH